MKWQYWGDSGISRCKEFEQSSSSSGQYAFGNRLSPEKRDSATLAMELNHRVAKFRNFQDIHSQEEVARQQSGQE
jgi:hypothetical protein